MDNLKGWMASSGRFMFGEAKHVTKGYEILEKGFGSKVLKGIKCKTCGKTSWHPQDVKNIYCASCAMFHETH